MVGETQPAKASSAGKASTSKGKPTSKKGKGKSADRSGKEPMVAIKEGAAGDGETVELGDEIEVFYHIRLRDGTTIEKQHETPVRHFVRVAALFRLIFLPSAHHACRRWQGYQRSLRTHFSCIFFDQTPGWDNNIAGMKVGGNRQLTIPPELAFGNSAVGKIPANSTVVIGRYLLVRYFPALYSKCCGL